MKKILFILLFLSTIIYSQDYNYARIYNIADTMSARLSSTNGAWRLYENASSGSPNIIAGYSGNLMTGTGANFRANIIAGGGLAGLINKISGNETRYATISGGYDNYINGDSSTTDIDGAASTISGGAHNEIRSTHATIGGGSYGYIGAGSDYSTIRGGTQDTIIGSNSVISGGTSNKITGNYSTIGGGYLNDNLFGFGTIAGGRGNTIAAEYGSILGGQGNSASDYATASGYNNTASGYGSVAMGRNNTASNYYSTAFGYGNTVSGERSIAVGYNNVVGGEYSGAFGREMNVSHSYSFGFALSDQNGATLQTSGVMSIMGGIGVGINTLSPDERFEVEFGDANKDVEIGVGTSDPDVTFITLRSPNGTKYYITVDDAGALSASASKP